MRAWRDLLLVLLVVTVVPLEAEVRYDRSFLPVRDPLTTGEPPFAGTVWVNSNIVNSSDPSVGRRVTYKGRGQRLYWDCPATEWIDINAYLFDVRYDSRPTPTEFQVHPDSGELDSVREFVDDFALVLGRMPRALMANVKEIELINGVPCGAANPAGIIHWGRDPDRWVEQNGYLEELLFHEAVHATLDTGHLRSAGWRAAQEADGNSISDYARDFPDSEDLAETALMWFAVRYHPERLTAIQRNAILDAVPNRLAYLDEQMFDMSPYTKATTPVPASTLFVPVLLTSAGRNNAFFTSELALTNRGSDEATLHYTYTARSGGGSGTGTDRLAAGRQRIESNAIDYLTGLGIPIPDSGNRIGTLRVQVSGSSEVSVVTRTTTAVPDGRAGLSYPAIAKEEGFQEAVYLCGLRQNTQDRSNLAFQNMGALEDGPITLRTTIYSGEPDDTDSLVVGETTLPPGGFHQYSGLLGRLGNPAQGYVKVEKVEGDAPFYAYGVINDNFNSDGSFVFPVTESSLVGTSGQTLPVIIETGSFQSELTVTNFSREVKTVHFRFVADAVDTGDDTAAFSVTLKAGEQSILPNVVNHLRQQGVDGIGPEGRAFVGALFAAVAEGDLSGIVIGGRTGSPDGRGGQYSLFYDGVPYGAAFTGSAWVEALQQNGENRSNLALVNTGEVDGSESVFNLDIYDGQTGMLANTVTGIRLAARRWHQINGILGDYAPGTPQGYVRIRKDSGNNPFLAYGVINDGGAPGQRSDDGAYLPARK